MPDQKIQTLRLDRSRARELETVAQIDGTSVSEAVRSAIDKYIDERRRDPEFRRRLDEYMSEYNDILERLAK